MFQANLFGSDPDPSDKRVNWKFFAKPEGGYYLHTYTLLQTLRTAPKPLRHLTGAPVGHTSYEYGNKGGFITVFDVQANRAQLMKLAKENHKKAAFFPRPNRKYGPDTDLRHNIKSKTTLKGADLEAFIDYHRFDIATFCDNKDPSENQDASEHFTLVDKIEPTHIIRKIPPIRRFLKKGKGKYHDICKIVIGINAYSEGCIANITPEGLYDPDARCGYCYARNQNSIAANESVYDFTVDQLVKLLFQRVEEHPDEQTLVIRLGQNSEVYWPKAMRDMYDIPFEDNFFNTLIALGEVNKQLKKDGRKIAVPLPSKTLEFDERYVQPMLDANVIYMPSIAYQELEEGIVNQGFGYEQRLKTGLQYAQAGCPVTIFGATDVIRPRSDWQEDMEVAFDFFLSHMEKLSFQILEMRLTKKAISRMITGKDWDELKSSNRYRQVADSNNYLKPSTVHPDYLQLMKDMKGKVTMCTAFAPKEHQYCGGYGFK